MTAGDPKGRMPASRIPKEAKKLVLYGLESLSCIVPKAAHREAADFGAATESDAIMFPLKESYSKNVQHPNSHTYWDNAVKDYRHTLLNEIAEEEEIKSCSQAPTRPRIRSTPGMPLRSHSHLDPRLQVSEANGSKEYKEWNREKNISENELRAEVEHLNHYVWETENQEDLFFHPHHDVHYNAILDVQEDEDRRRNSDIFQCRSHFVTEGGEVQLRTDVINQEYLRLKAISEKHERENAIRKSRMNIARNETENILIISGQPLSSDRPQRTVERNVYSHKDAVFDSQYSYGKISVSNLSSPSNIDEKDAKLSASSTRALNSSQEPHRNSASSDSRWSSFGDCEFVNRDTGLGSRHSIGSTVFLSESSPAMSQAEIDAAKRASAATPNGCSDLYGATLMSTLTVREEQTPANETFKKSSSFENASKSIRENKFMSKITFIESQHSLDPILVSTTSSPQMSAYRQKKSSNATTAFSKGNEVILEKDMITQEGQHQRLASFNRRQGEQTESPIVGKGTAQYPSGPMLISLSSSLASIHLDRQDDAKSFASIAPRDMLDLSTSGTHEHFRPSHKLRGTMEEEKFPSKTGGVLDPRLNHDPTVTSESSTPIISWHKRGELVAESTQYLKDPTQRQERRSNHHSTFYASSHIELNSPATVSELWHKPGASIRPITPSPIASGSHSQQFEISPERDVRCEIGKRHQFYEANLFIPAYSDSVIIGRPISPEQGIGYGKQEHGSIDGLSPVTCSGSQFRNSIFTNTARQVGDEWGDELIDHDRSDETVKVQYLCSQSPNSFHPPQSSQTCMPLFNKKLRLIVDCYHQKLKDSSMVTVPQAKS